MKVIWFLLMFLFGLESVHSQVDPEKLQELYTQGKNHLKSNNNESAEKVFTELVTISPEYEGLRLTYIYRGIARDRLGKYDLAIEDFTEAIRMNPNDPASYTDRGLSYLHKGESEPAIDDFKQVLKIDSVAEQAEAANYWLGRIYTSSWEAEKAIYYWDRLLNLAPKDYEAYFYRGLTKSNAMDSKGAIEDYDNAIKYNPNYMEAYTNRAYSKINLLLADGYKTLTKEETRSACEDFEVAIKLGDEKYDLYYIHCTQLSDKKKKK